MVHVQGQQFYNFRPPRPFTDGVSAKDSIELLNECFLFAADSSFEVLCRPEKKKKKKKKKEVTKIKWRKTYYSDTHSYLNFPF